jgi:glycyl-tRNA synthetase beta chain
MSGMVGEFPELQGIMGRYYAGHDGEDGQVAAAMAEQYLPRYAGDELPAGGVGQSLAIADKLDTLTGIFGVGEAPTGDKDPFALRRAALGVLRILIERQLDLDLVELLSAAVGRFDLAFEPGGTVEQVYGFMMDRLRAYYHDIGISADVFEAVRSREPRRPLDFDRRVRAVMAFRELKEAESLTAANKRIRNILRQAGTVPQAAGDDTVLLVESAEQALAKQVEELTARVTPLFEGGDYTAALKQLAGLRAVVDRFFDDVMVMAEDERLRGARLRLLDRLSELFLRVADLSKLQG